jgi:hypothetical protein
MKPLCTMTRVKNLTTQPRFLRWLTKAGMFLAPGQEAVVEGFYPSAVDKQNMLSQCIYDIENGLVEIELITNMTSRQPTEAEVKGLRPQSTYRSPAQTDPTGISAQLPLAKKDERWAVGTIEDMKPPARVLPGHEETLATAGKPPKTLDIFPGGPSVETPTVAPRAADANPPPPAETGGDKTATDNTAGVGRGRRRMAV